MRHFIAMRAVPARSMYRGSLRAPRTKAPKALEPEVMLSPSQLRICAFNECLQMANCALDCPSNCSAHRMVESMVEFVTVEYYAYKLAQFAQLKKQQ